MFRIFSNCLMLSALFVLVTQTACLKAEEDPVDQSNEVPEATVNEALSKPIKDNSPLDMKIGETTTIETLLSVNRGGFKLYGRLGIEILGRGETTDTVKFSVKITEMALDEEGKEKTTEQSGIIEFKKSASVASNNAKMLDTLGLKTELSAATKKTYHHLNVSQGFITAPQTNEKSSGCEKFQDCKIPVTLVKFYVLEYLEGSVERHDFEYILSGDVPYFSTTIQKCETFQIKYESRRVLATRCDALTDFTFGANPE